MSEDGFVFKRWQRRRWWTSSWSVRLCVCRRLCVLLPFRHGVERITFYFSSFPLYRLVAIFVREFLSFERKRISVSVFIRSIRAVLLSVNFVGDKTCWFTVVTGLSAPFVYLFFTLSSRKYNRAFNISSDTQWDVFYFVSVVECQTQTQTSEY